jgi:RNA polymerase sigma factor (sigma-70 family)
MDGNELLAEQFEEYRTHLRAVAYRMLGSLSEADDAVQEAWLRLSRTCGDDVENLGGWLTTVVSRVCLNMLRSRATRREVPLTPHVPDPIVRGAAPASDGDRARQREVVDAFFAAARLGDFEALIALLDPDVVLRSDRGALPRSAVVRGAEAVAAQELMFADPSRLVLPALVNGAAGVVVAAAGRPVSVMGFTVAGGKIVAVDALSDPERLDRLDLAVLDD